MKIISLILSIFLAQMALAETKASPEPTDLSPPQPKAEPAKKPNTLPLNDTNPSPAPQKPNPTPTPKPKK